MKRKNSREEEIDLEESEEENEKKNQEENQEEENQEEENEDEENEDEENEDEENGEKENGEQNSTEMYQEEENNQDTNNKQKLSISNTIFSFLSNLKKREEFKILSIGLDNAGKTTIISKLNDESLTNQGRIEVIPTVGYQIEKIKFENKDLLIYDLSGQSKYRNMWEYFYTPERKSTGNSKNKESNTSIIDGIVFTVDSAASDRFPILKDELNLILKIKKLKKIPILFFLNKKDKKKTISKSNFIKFFQLDNPKIISNPFQIIESSATQGIGISQGFKWLISTIQNM